MILKLETNEFALERIDQSLVKAVLRTHMELTLTHISRFDQALEMLASNQAHGLILDISKVIYIHQEAREFLVHALQTSESTLATALVTETMLSKFAGKLFLNLHQPLIPIALFDHHTEAKQWIISSMNNLRVDAA